MTNGYISAVRDHPKPRPHTLLPRVTSGHKPSPLTGVIRAGVFWSKGNVAEILPLLTHHSAKLLWQAPEGTNVKSKALQSRKGWRIPN